MTTEPMDRGGFACVLRGDHDDPVANHHKRVSGVPSGMFAPGKFNG